jgi:hypothetical protein
MAFRDDVSPLNAFPVTPSDTTIVSAFGFYVGGTGDVAVMPFAQESATVQSPVNGNTTPTAIVFKACPVGLQVALKISRFMATATTASEIVGFGPT